MENLSVPFNLSLPLAQWWNFPFHPEQASTIATEVDMLYFALWGLTIVFTALVLMMLIVFVLRFRKGTKVNRANPQHHNTALELSWSIVPLILGLIIFVWGAKLYADAYTIPSNASTVYVIGKQWMWHMQHQNGIRENNELHVPVGKPIKLEMISQDVIHSFFVPAFRIKRDVLPGIYTSVWFEATKPGKYHLFCAEFCGTQHSLMIGSIYVMQPADYQRWLDTNGAKPGDATRKTPVVRQTMEEQGAELYQQLNCANCHAAEDGKRGPSLYGIYNRKRQLTDGRIVVADRNYLREALVKPYDKINAGYDKTMPAYDQLREEQINSLIAYMRSLGTASEPKSPVKEPSGRPSASQSARTNNTANTNATSSRPNGN
jgi:cytochrome c oxidase subunit 2